MKKRTPHPDLKTWRNAAGLTQTQAAQLFGITQSYYAKLENGRQFARGQVAKRITEATGVPVAVLVGAA